jgi:hypothetical protein
MIISIVVIVSFMVVMILLGVALKNKVTPKDIEQPQVNSKII